jgi:hypothetical protein
MSHPDPLFDPDNAYGDDEMFLEPDESDIPFIEYLYDDHEDFYEDEDEAMADDYDDSMDGDHESGLASAGWGTDEDYGHYGDDIEAFHDYYGEDY